MSIEPTAVDPAILAVLRRLRDEIEAAVPGVVAVPVRRFGGKRWAAMADVPPSRELPLAASHRIALGEEYGVILYGWSALGPADRESIEHLCAAFAAPGSG